MGVLKGTADTIEVNVSTKITEDLGRFTPIKFKVTFNRREYEDAKDLIDQMNDPESDVTEATIVENDIVSWRDLPGDGGEVEYTHENLAICLQHPEYRQALFNAWGEAQLRRLLARTKN